MMATRLVLGTAALGQTYGLVRAAGTPLILGAPEASAILSHAHARGVRRVDTAPGYGQAESRIGGSGLATQLEIWTKVAGAPGDAFTSLSGSLERLGVTRVAAVQWHNWSARQLDDHVFWSTWNELRSRFPEMLLGATTYGAHDAAAACRSGLFDALQVEWNILNRSVVTTLRDLPVRGTRPLEVTVRSVYLQGALTDEGRAVPASAPLASALDALRRLAREAGLSATAIALRAALFEPGIDRVVLGIDAPEQLDVALAAEAGGPLPSDVDAAVRRLELGPIPDIDPRAWPPSKP